MTIARVRATSYLTRGSDLLVFTYPEVPAAGTHLPGGGVEPGERPDDAARREAVEETGITGNLTLQGLVGIQQGTYNTGLPRISAYFHFTTDEPRDSWTHTMIGDEGAWDTGLEVTCTFVPLTEAAALLKTSWHDQHEFLPHLRTTDAGQSPLA